MMTFDTIARELLKEQGFEVLECETDEEAIDKAEQLKNGSKNILYIFRNPIHPGKNHLRNFIQIPKRWI